MTKKDLKNLQDSLYSTILPPSESLKPAYDKGFHLIANIKNSFLNENNINCHPEERSELRILPIMEDNKERLSDSEYTKSSQDRKDECFRMTKKCHPELVSGSYQPGDSTHDRSDSEHTRLVDESHAERFRMTKNTEGRGEAKEFTLNSLPLPLGEGRGEGAISKSTEMRTGRQHKINPKNKI